MLERLEVKNLAVLEAATLEFGPGLTVLTGETGAGKSILVDALSLLLGVRADPGLIRPGAEHLLVTAWFDGRPFSRRVGPARSVPRIDGEVVTLRELAEATAARLAIHAQHAALTLATPRSHRALLDATVPSPTRAAYRKAYATYRALLEEEARLHEAARERERRLDVLRFQLEEIQKANPTPGEDEALAAEAEKLRHLEVLRERVALALQRLSGEEADALGLVGEAVRALRSAARHDPALTPLGEDLEAAASTLYAIVQELEQYLEDLEADPARLEAVEARLALLERLKRKYGDSLEEVRAFAEATQREIEHLETAETRLGEVRQALAEAEEAVWQAGQALSTARRQAAQALEAAATRELRALGMPEARLEVRLEAQEAPGPEGLEEVRFLFSANPNLPPAPLERAASGGEMSRVMLALALLTGSEAETVVFDEVDAGIGGEAAWAVAQRLDRLAAERQVLVVTHLAQIAARAATHYRVVKEEGRVRVERVEGEARVREIARMLSGSYSEAALRHARELLEGRRADV
ncbi:DNA repair protein RecN [Marinithermus hydrothermalis]|uniref:DNA repair protein RecN n=1 Tax=Marinithermus hydrothermalis (strain DSM 14884 / JCM 11576 / T1) TaxID=869210 RepID=F2NQS2_MARHT|nr:DNA repair protein RecN [Marinithermus hydrothermalis]AEB12286.1 DNA repair protein RecN [Marinithermus hydrothermalis DSM 14884]